MRKYAARSGSLVLQAAVLGIFEEQEPRLTVRQIYYALTVRGLVPKTEAGYRQTCYQLGQMRARGIIPYGWIADNTRWQLKPDTHHSLQDALAYWQSAYRHDLWRNQPYYVEIWVEKDALGGVVSPITLEYDVPLYVCRGYSSSTYLFEAAEYLKELGKPAYIYHFGDFDPSGVDAAHKVRDGLQKHGADIHFQRMAVTPAQISQLNLPGRETKRSDPRARQWGNKLSVELDALPAPVLRQLVRQCIERHLDLASLAVTRLIEQGERDSLAEFSRNFVLAQDSDSSRP